MAASVGRASALAAATSMSAPGTTSTASGSGAIRSPSAYAIDPGRREVDATRACGRCTAGWLTWVPLKTLGNTRRNSGLEIFDSTVTVEQPVVDRRPGADPHAAAVRRAVADRDQHGLGLHPLAVEVEGEGQRPGRRCSSATIATL